MNKEDITQDTLHKIQSNMFTDSMPKMLSKQEYFDAVRHIPKLPYKINDLSSEDRRNLLSELNSVCIPMDYMYEIYDVIYRGMMSNYHSADTIMNTKMINNVYFSNNMESKGIIQHYSGAVLGVPGIGKTSTLKRSLALFPDCIKHTEYNNKPVFCNQIPYLFVECPCDCSIKTLVLNIINAIDTALGSDYLKGILRIKSISVSALMIRVKIMCMTHHVGIIVIDEIQNAVITANRNKQVRPLIKFLVELTNETCVSICFSGTLKADELFSEEEHLFRRTRGYRLLPMKPDKTYYDFIRYLWDYQVTLQKIAFSEQLANLIYDLSKGIPAHIVKIFQETQIQAIISGKEVISKEVIKIAAQKNMINVSQECEDGMSISDFRTNEDEHEALIRKKKGRPTVKRDSSDLLKIYETVNTAEELLVKLTNNGLIETMEV